VEERLDIDTPEGVVFDYQVAGIGSRFIAALIDTIILTVLLWIFSCASSATMGFLPELGSWAAAWLILISSVLLWGYYIFFELIWNGQSPGKRRAGLRVIRVDGTPITLVDSLIRNLVRIIDFLPFLYALGLVTMFFNAQARRLGDYAAGTLVVKEQRDVTLTSLTQSSWSGPPTALNLSQDDYRLVTEFLERRYELRNRDELALRIAAAVAAKLGLPQPTSAAEAEALLTRLARQSRQE
jgi:uncharacterized RDD family membrane protein YckC